MQGMINGLFLNPPEEKIEVFTVEDPGQAHVLEAVAKALILERITECWMFEGGYRLYCGVHDKSDENAFAFRLKESPLFRGYGVVLRVDGYGVCYGCEWKVEDIRPFTRFFDDQSMTILARQYHKQGRTDMLIKTMNAYV